jgi:phospholipase/carboxylesterase
MNRLHLPKAASSDLASSSQASLANGGTRLFPGVASKRRDRTIPEYSLFAPLHYERRYAYPLLVWLHDDGGNERELRQLMPHVSLRNYVAVAARGATGAKASDREFGWEQTPTTVGEAVDRVRQCIDVASERFNVHPQRVFIAGNGRGGTMALRVALQFPEWFAGAVSLGGALPVGDSPLGRVKQARQLPLLLATCRDSQVYPPAKVAEDLRLLHSAGFSLALRTYPGEHDLTTVMLADLDRWLMGRICPATATATASER